MSQEPGPLSGRVAVVTGGGRGIGAAITRRLAAAGAQVAALYHRDEVSAQETARAVGEQGGRALALRCDVSQASAVRQAFAEVDRELGPTSILVNNAGAWSMAPILELTEAEWHEVVETDLSGAFYCLQEAGRRMAAGGWGRIVNISSIAGKHPELNLAHYGAAKAGLVGLTRQAALELGSSGITVNAVSPGAVKIGAPDEPDRREGRFSARAPMGRLGKPEDVAAAVLFLVSPEAGWVTGRELVVDGGVLLAPSY